MGSMTKFLATCALMLGSVTAAPGHGVRPGQPDLKVSLDYATYQGTRDNTSGLNVWNGIRYAAAPTGNLRWKAPQSPIKTSDVIVATEYGPTCPMTMPSIGPGSVPYPLGNEDCLFLNVVAPPVSGKAKLPVLVWIHGGGYGLGHNHEFDLREIINANNNGFIGVSIQYRLGAFGFLSSEEVKMNGTPNAGLLDMKFALEWVQKNIAKFGGDARKVTISGESAGAGAVMLLGVAKGGKLGSSLFLNGIAASPYLPAQYDYNAVVPTKNYYDFAAAAGCGSTGAVLDCLRSKDTETLQQANFQISTTQTYGTWAYYPVTDYDFIQSLTSKALASGRLNGQNMLVGNNANEGGLFVDPTIATEDQLKAWLKLEFPTFNAADIQKVLDANPIPATIDPASPKYETNGLTGATATWMSQIATGHQQRANNIYAEATFICPGYWINDAYAKKGRSYHYQYSVPFASHGNDQYAYFGPNKPNQSPEFSQAFRQIWGNMIMKSNPSIASEPAARKFPMWEGGRFESRMINLNETGGVPAPGAGPIGQPVVEFHNPGLKNDIKNVDAYAWEGGRGKRCEFYRSMAQKISI